MSNAIPSCEPSRDSGSPVQSPLLLLFKYPFSIFLAPIVPAAAQLKT